MQLERRALYNSLRQNWLHDPHMAVEPWQVDDYRSLSVETLFERLRPKQIYIDRTMFTALADEVESPEDLAESLIPGDDEVYLIVFELWRRLMNEKPSLSIFCDELDHQIYLYDTGLTKRAEDVEDALANLEVILDENVDNGANPLNTFELISEGCANDIETFLYDFIGAQIDDQNISYAGELLEDFGDYLKDVKWFDLLKARVVFYSDEEGGNIFLEHVVEDSLKGQDLEFDLEVLHFLAQEGRKKDFLKVAQHAAKLLEFEEDFLDLMSIAVDLFHFHDDEERELKVHALQDRRQAKNRSGRFSSKDEDLEVLLAILKS